MPSYVLPVVPAPWISGALRGPIPRETRATCHDCAMCPREPQPDSPYLFFDPQVKCCSYLPDLANFLVGGVLATTAAETAEGRASVIERIRQRDGVSPLGLQMTAGYAQVYHQMRTGFGRSHALRCPHFVVTDGGGHCGIWDHRPSVCATFFCKHDRGAVGERFWLCLRDWLSALEAELSSWCALQLGAPPEAPPVTGRPEPGGPTAEELDAAIYQAAWGTWNGRELEYYRQCADLVRPLDGIAVKRLTSPRVQELSGRLARSYDELISSSVPERLAAGKFAIDGMDDGHYRVTAYSINDPLHLTERLVRALPYFAGQPWNEAVTSITADLGFTIDQSLLRRMVDFGLLTASEGGRE